MKSIIIILLTISFGFAQGQDILIPYRVNDKFGLSDVNGKMIVAPAYDELNWIRGNWFKTSQTVELNDSIETAPNRFYTRKDKTKLTGLIYKNKTILSGQPYSNYEIIPGKCIVAKCDRSPGSFTKEQFKLYKNNSRFISLFSLEGKNVYPDNFTRLQKVDTVGISAKNKQQSRYILFMCQNLKEQYSIFVFDIDKQEITDWLLKDQYKLKLTGAERDKKMITFEATDMNYVVTDKRINYQSGKFIITTYTPEKKEISKMGDMGSDRVPEVIEYSGSNDAVIAEEGRETIKEYPFTPYFEFLKDSLKYYSAADKIKHIVLPKDAQPIFMQGMNRMQYQPVIYKQQNKFGLIDGLQIGEPVFDSLVYFGKNFIACKSENNTSRCGMLGPDGKEIVPMEYDSIYTGTRWIDAVVTSKPGKGVPGYSIVLKQPGPRHDYGTPKVSPYTREQTSELTIFKNGKAGLINLKNEIIVPIAFDLIAGNALQSSGLTRSNFTILKNNGKYGLTDFKYNQQTKKSEMTNTIEPVFEMIPAYMMDNYYNVKGFRLIVLYNENDNFVGYANEKGFLYFSDTK